MRTIKIFISFFYVHNSYSKRTAFVLYNFMRICWLWHCCWLYPLRTMSICLLYIISPLIRLPFPKRSVMHAHMEWLMNNIVFGMCMRIQEWTKGSLLTSLNNEMASPQCFEYLIWNLHHNQNPGQLDVEN